MRPVQLSAVALLCEGRHLGADVRIEAVGTDTRSLPKGALLTLLERASLVRRQPPVDGIP